jgi:hypothetical protein
MEMNVEEAKVIRISSQTSPPQIIIDKKTAGECGIFQLVG